MWSRCTGRTGCRRSSRLIRSSEMGCRDQRRPSKVRTTYNKPLRVESVEIDEELNAWQAFEPASDMHCSVAIAAGSWWRSRGVEDQSRKGRDCRHFKGDAGGPILPRCV